MINHAGALYIPVNGRVLQFTEAGTLQDIWVARDYDLPTERFGSVAYLVSTNNWLLAVTQPSSPPKTGWSSERLRHAVWAWQTEGWHPLTSLVVYQHNSTATHTQQIYQPYYDRALQRVWIGGNDGQVFYIYVPDYAINPISDSGYKFAYTGFLETPKIFGDVYKLDKDYESVSLFGDSLAAATSVAVYWKDDESTAWESLGTVDADDEELRWSTYTTRPASKWVKLGLLLTSTNPDSSPQVRATVVKYHPMVADRWQWTVSIPIANYLEMPDGTYNKSATAAQRMTALDALVQSVPPIFFQDINGSDYEVKITAAQRSVSRYQYLPAGTTSLIEYIYNLTLEQVTTGTS
jgi:hypothetical protein